MKAQAPFSILAAALIVISALLIGVVGVESAQPIGTSPTPSSGNGPASGFFGYSTGDLLLGAEKLAGSIQKLPGPIQHDVLTKFANLTPAAQASMLGGLATDARLTPDLSTFGCALVAAALGFVVGGSIGFASAGTATGLAVVVGLATAGVVYTLCTQASVTANLKSLIAYEFAARENALMWDQINLTTANLATTESTMAAAGISLEAQAAHAALQQLNSSTFNPYEALDVGGALEQVWSVFNTEVENLNSSLYPFVGFANANGQTGANLSGVFCLVAAYNTTNVNPICSAGQNLPPALSPNVTEGVEVPVGVHFYYPGKGAWYASCFVSGSWVAPVFKDSTGHVITVAGLSNTTNLTGTVEVTNPNVTGWNHTISGHGTILWASGCNPAIPMIVTSAMPYDISQSDVFGSVNHYTFCIVLFVGMAPSACTALFNPGPSNAIENVRFKQSLFNYPTFCVSSSNSCDPGNSNGTHLPGTSTWNTTGLNALAWTQMGPKIDWLLYNASIVSQAYWTFLRSLGYTNASQVPFGCVIPEPWQAIPVGSLQTLNESELQQLYYAWLNGLATFFNSPLNASGWCGGHPQFSLGNQTWNTSVNATGYFYDTTGGNVTPPTQKLDNQSSWAYTGHSAPQNGPLGSPTQMIMWMTNAVALVNASYHGTSFNIPVGQVVYVPLQDPMDIMFPQLGVFGAAYGNGSLNPAATPLSKTPGDALYLLTCTIYGAPVTICAIGFSTINGTLANISCGAQCQGVSVPGGSIGSTCSFSGLWAFLNVLVCPIINAIANAICTISIGFICGASAQAFAWFIFALIVVFFVAVGVRTWEWARGGRRPSYGGYRPPG